MIKQRIKRLKARFQTLRKDDPERIIIVARIYELEEQQRAEQEYSRKVNN